MTCLLNKSNCIKMERWNDLLLVNKSENLLVNKKHFHKNVKCLRI